MSLISLFISTTSREFIFWLHCITRREEGSWNAWNGNIDIVADIAIVKKNLTSLTDLLIKKYNQKEKAKRNTPVSFLKVKNKKWKNLYNNIRDTLRIARIMVLFEHHYNRKRSKPYHKKNQYIRRCGLVRK